MVVLNNKGRCGAYICWIDFYLLFLSFVFHQLLQNLDAAFLNFRVLLICLLFEKLLASTISFLFRFLLNFLDKCGLYTKNRGLSFILLLAFIKDVRYLIGWVLHVHKFYPVNIHAWLNGRGQPWIFCQVPWLYLTTWTTNDSLRFLQVCFLGQNLLNNKSWPFLSLFRRRFVFSHWFKFLLALILRYWRQHFHS